MKKDSTQEFFTTAEVANMIGSNPHTINYIMRLMDMQCARYNHTKYLFTQEQAGAIRRVLKAKEYLNKRGLREFIKNNLELTVGSHYYRFEEKKALETDKIYEFDMEQKLQVV